MGNQTYYQTLGVSNTATADEIKRAYRKLARQYHPDVNKAADAEERMKAINSAYDILSDSQKRADYDRFGQYSNPSQNYQQPYQQGSQQYYQFDSMDDLFAQLFGQQFRQQQQRQQQQYQQTRRPVQTSFFSKVVQFFYMFLMIRFLLWFFLPF